jgi:hypothetical protein
VVGEGIGTEVGNGIGTGVGNGIGTMVGAGTIVGTGTGRVVGTGDGEGIGIEVGNGVGICVGSDVGREVGTPVGAAVVNASNTGNVTFAPSTKVPVREHSHVTESLEYPETKVQSSPSKSIVLSSQYKQVGSTYGQVYSKK